MHEQYDNNDDTPRLLESEILSLVEFAKTRGEARDANHVDEQPVSRLHPHFFLFTVDPQVIDMRWHLRAEDYSEIITGIAIEYNESMVIDPEDTAPMERWVSVTITSIAYDSAVSALIDKQVRYRLSLDLDGVSEAVETRSDENPRLDLPIGDERSVLEALANEARSLNADDLQLLRFLISRL
jgi:hypothetical protein